MDNYMYGPGDWGPGHMVVVQGGHDWMLPFWLGTLMPFAILFILWALVWKGLALWHSARRGQYWWFLALLIVNTFGILEIIYLFVVAKFKAKEVFALPPRQTHHEGHSH
jgi:methionyl-tRNA synthetase